MKKEKILFESESIYSFDEYLKFYNTLRLAYYNITIYYGFIFCFIFLIFAVINKISVLYMILGILFINAVLILIRSSNREQKIKKEYDNLKIKDVLTKIKFYETYMIRENEYNKVTIFYDEIKKIVETKTNFYILTDKYSILQKDKCSEELIKFIQNMKIKSYIDYSSGKKVNKTNPNNSLIIGITMIYFAPIFIDIIISSVTNISNLTSLLIILPFYILVLILSIIYRKRIRALPFIIIDILTILVAIINVFNN